MGHSEHFEMVKRYYKMKVWSEARVRNAVVKGWLTEEEFTEITGKDYAEAEE